MELSASYDRLIDSKQRKTYDDMNYFEESALHKYFKKEFNIEKEEITRRNKKLNDDHHPLMAYIAKKYYQKKREYKYSKENDIDHSISNMYYVSGICHSIPYTIGETIFEDGKNVLKVFLFQSTYTPVNVTDPFLSKRL